jgi:NAD(P)H-hydrate epimerase
MKILTAAQLRELERFTMKQESIDSYELMQRAAKGVLNQYLNSTYGPLKRLVVLCGKGNNGGDGLAFARLISKEFGLDDDSEQEMGRGMYFAKPKLLVVVIEHSEKGSKEFAKNLYLLNETGVVDIVHVRRMADFPELKPEDRIIDAMLGTGLSRPLDGILEQVVRHINTLPNPIASIDVPTGLFAEDNSENDLNTVVQADITYTFHCPKLSFLMPEWGNPVGRLSVVNIGLLEEQQQPESQLEYFTQSEFNNWRRRRSSFDHKGNYGHALLLAGSKGKMGAAQLAAEGCLRSGVGLVTAHVPQCGLNVMQSGIPEAMCTLDADKDKLTQLPDLYPFDAIGVGPGIGTDEATAQMLKHLLETTTVPLVLDADALNILARNPDWLHLVPANSILTPHPKEFERLAGPWNSTTERWELQRQFAKRYTVYLVVKGAFTSVTTPEGVIHFNSTGNPGMATAGMGDVLTGVVLSLLAQGYEPLKAAQMAAYSHGYAGDMCLVEEHSVESLIASDVLAKLGYAFDTRTPFI